MVEVQRAALTSFVFCWQLERRDGAGIAMTSGDVPIRVEGQKFDPAPGLVPAGIVRGEVPESQPGETEGALTADGFTEDDLLSGRWDGSRARLLTVDASDRAPKAIPLLEGELGEVSLDGNRFRADLLGAASKVQGVPCTQTSPECRATLGDKACRVDLAGRRQRRKVVEGGGAQLVLDAPCADSFVTGCVRWLDGPNCGLQTVILAVSGNRIQLRDVPRFGVAGGESVLLQEGCDKRFPTCIERFDNAANFRGEPHLPGNDLLTRYPGR